MNLLAKSCFAPGIISFISNLITSSAAEEGDDDNENTWRREYTEGMDHEIYRCALSPKMENQYFSEVVRIIYKSLKAIVFALEVKCNQNTIIRLNPSDFIVNNIEENAIFVYCICPTSRIAEAIETLDMSKEEINRYWAQKTQKQKGEETPEHAEPQTV